MQLTAPTAPAAASYGPSLPEVKLHAVPFSQLPFGRPAAGWTAMPGHGGEVHGGTLVAAQDADPSAIAQVDRGFGRFYGATARVNVALGDVVGNLGAFVDDAFAVRRAVELASRPGAPSIAVVREGASLVLREALSPVMLSPYASGLNAHGHPHWGAFRIHGATDPAGPSWNDGGEIDALRFTSASVRAIIDGAAIIRNPAR